MMHRRLLVTLFIGVLLAGCSGSDGEGSDGVGSSGASSAEEAVEELIGHLAEGDFTAAAPLAIPGQAALASLAESAPLEEVAAGVENGDELIAVNFWSGFAQSVQPWLADEGLQIGQSSQQTAEGVEFDVVPVVVPPGTERHLTTRNVDGYRIDLFATFGPSLASRLYPQVERLLASDEPDAAVVLSGIRDQVPSLHQAVNTPGLAPNVVQDILQLIELITRIN